MNYIFAKKQKYVEKPTKNELLKLTTCPNLNIYRKKGKTYRFSLCFNKRKFLLIMFANL